MKKLVLLVLVLTIFLASCAQESSSGSSFAPNSSSFTSSSSTLAEISGTISVPDSSLPLSIPANSEDTYIIHNEGDNEVWMYRTQDYESMSYVQLLITLPKGCQYSGGVFFSDTINKLWTGGVQPILDENTIKDTLIQSRYADEESNSVLESGSYLVEDGDYPREVQYYHDKLMGDGYLYAYVYAVELSEAQFILLFFYSNAYDSAWAHRTHEPIVNSVTFASV